MPTFEALLLYYQMRCRLAEGYDMFALAADRFAADETLLAGMLLLGKSWFTIFGGTDTDDRLLATMRRGITILNRHTLPGLGAMLLWSGHIVYLAKGELQRMLGENEAAYRTRGDDWGLGWILSQGKINTDGYRLRTRADLEAGIAAALRCGDRWGATWSQAVLGLMAEEEGKLDEATTLYRQRLETCEQVGDKGGVAWSLHQLAKVSLERDDITQALYYCRESLRVALEISSVNSINEAIWRIAAVYRKRGAYAREVELLSVLDQPHNSSHYKHFENNIANGLQAARIQLSPDAYERAVESGRQWTSRQLGYALLNELDGLMMETSPAYPMPTNTLTEFLSEREMEVLRLVADGLSNSEIAERLVVTTGTIKKHLNNIYGKLGVERRTQALLHAQELGLIDRQST
jgi:DNA-binding CsgD family transcriptional regulator